MNEELKKAQEIAYQRKQHIRALEKKYQNLKEAAEEIIHIFDVLRGELDFDSFTFQPLRIALRELD